jgi:hypothetical protein
MKIQVKAIDNGYYGNIRRKPGAVFEVEEKHFSKKWMKKLVDSEPSKKKEESKKSSDSEVI